VTGEPTCASPTTSWACATPCRAIDHRLGIEDVRPLYWCGRSLGNRLKVSHEPTTSHTTQTPRGLVILVLFALMVGRPLSAPSVHQSRAPSPQSEDPAQVALATGPWSPDYLDGTVKYGSHKSANEFKDFLREKMLANIKSGHRVVLTYALARNCFMSCPQRDRRPRTIVDYTFSGVNSETVRSHLMWSRPAAHPFKILSTPTRNLGRST
jgi:hypothetical protein